MNEAYTHAVCILDKSSSMEHLTNETIAGYNNFLKEQKLVPGKMTLTLRLFDTYQHRVYDFVDLREAPELTRLTYVCGGWTALRDSLGDTMTDTGNKLARMAESERPGRVIFWLISDGEENKSIRYSQQRIKEMVEHQRSVYNWQFMFLGANQDAILEGAKLGIQTDFAATYNATSRGTETAHKMSSDKLRAYRCASPMNVKSMAYSASDKAELLHNS